MLSRQLLGPNQLYPQTKTSTQTRTRNDGGKERGMHADARTAETCLCQHAADKSRPPPLHRLPLEI